MAVDQEKRQTLKWLLAGGLTAGLGTAATLYKLSSPSEIPVQISPTAVPSGHPEIESDVEYKQRVVEVIRRQAEAFNKNSANRLGNALEEPFFGFDFAQQQFQYAFLLRLPFLDKLKVFSQSSFDPNVGNVHLSFSASKLNQEDANCDTRFLGKSFAPYYCNQQKQDNNQPASIPVLLANLVGKPFLMEDDYRGNRSVYQPFENGEIFVLPDSRYYARHTLVIASSDLWYRLQLSPLLKKKPQLPFHSI